jgi:BolA protein
VAAAITRKLNQAFGPLAHFSLVDESHKHAGHSGMQDATRKTETHFKVVIVSDFFEGKPLIDRHRAVNECLALELSEGVHALSIDAKTLK